MWSHAHEVALSLKKVGDPWYKEYILTCHSKTKKVSTSDLTNSSEDSTSWNTLSRLTFLTWATCVASVSSQPALKVRLSSNCKTETFTSLKPKAVNWMCLIKHVILWHYSAAQTIEKLKVRFMIAVAFKHEQPIDVSCISKKLEKKVVWWRMVLIQFVAIQC